MHPETAGSSPPAAKGGQGNPVDPARAQSSFAKLDWLIVLILFSLGFCAVLLLTQARASSIVDLSRRWFESDVDENLQVMSDRAAQSGRAKVHPLFPLITYPVTYGIMSIGKLPPLEAVFAVNALTAGLWLVTFYAINRLVDCRRLDSLLFTGLAATSGAALFWFIVPETYPIGSLTILLSLLVVALARRRRVPDWCFVLASAATLSITVTNWMAGLISTAVRRSPRRAIALSLTALVIVAGLAAAERLIFFRTKGFFASPGGYALYKGYLLGKEQGGPLNAARVIFLTSEVVPRIELSRFPTQLDAKGPQLTIQRASAGSSGPVGQAATVFWGLLLAAGAAALIAGQGDRPFRIALGGTLLGQSALFMVYGEETFLYALNYVPLLILCASLATLSRWRYAVLACAGLMLPCVAWNNARQLRDALDHARQPWTKGALFDPSARAQPVISASDERQPGASVR